MVHLLIAASLAAASPASLPAPATLQDDPAMFVIQDADTTVYLFGTFHALDGDPRWFDRGVRGAFEQSDELVLETLIPEGPGPIIAGRRGLPIRAPSVTPSASFLATTRMAINAGVKLAIDTDAHSVGEFEEIHWGVGVARRAWVTAKDVINCWAFDELEAFIAKKR